LKRLERSVARAGALIAVLAAAAAVTPALASAATAPLTVAASASSPCAESGTTTTYFVNTAVTCGITYTVKSNVTGATLTGVGFTDQLPAGVALDDEVGETAKGCGSSFTPGSEQSPPTNAPGGTTVTESNLTVVNGTSCTVTLELVANTVETGSADAIAFSSAPVTSVVGSSPSTTLTSAQEAATDLVLTVAGPPTVSITGPSDNATYGYGQSVLLGFSAAPAANDSLAANGVYATDDQGNTLAPGQAVNTDVPGSHQVAFWVQTVDGYLGAVQTYSYTVNSPKLLSVKTTKTGDVDFDVEYLAAGSVAADVVDGKTVIAKVTKKVSVGKATAVTVAPTAAGKKALTKLTTVSKKVKEKYKVKVKVKGKTKVETKTKTVTKTTVKAIKVTLSVLYTASDYSYIGTQPTITKAGITLK
jgi:hypothetical protein